MLKKITENGQAAAVICELNPLHLGHRHLFLQAKARSEGLVCVLSGNFVQRGEPAVLDKWARARLALENGADLVIELPLPWACAGAERFADGGVFLAGALGCVDSLAFGSEFPDTAALERIAEALLSPAFSEKLAALPEDGSPFAARREAVLTELLGEELAPILRSPNAILAIEYCKALRSQGAGMAPMAFPRRGAGHDQPGTGEEFFSSSQLREQMKAGGSLRGRVPESTAALVEKLAAEGSCPGDISRLERSILCKLRTMSAEEFASLPDVSEGLEHRLYRAARQAASLEELYGLAKSKRYSHARIRRLVLAAFLGIPGDLPEFPPYLRVLGMNDTGERLLKAAKPSLPIAARPADFQKLGGDALRLFELEARADDLYELCKPMPGPCGRDHTEKLLRL